MKPHAAALPDMAGPHLKPEPQGRTRNPHGQPIDLVHLSRQTLGDKRLETELLRLFMRQSEQIRQSLATATHQGSATSALEMLHMLSGSARVIGATTVAALAGALEADMRRGIRGNLDETECGSLCGSIGITNAYIDALLDQA